VGAGVGAGVVPASLTAAAVWPGRRRDGRTFSASSGLPAARNVW